MLRGSATVHPGQTERRCRNLAAPAGESGRAEKGAGEHADAAGYIIQPGDLLLISVSGEPDFNQQVRVDWNGRINLPYLTGRGRSEIKAVGLNASELAERITEFAQHSNVLKNPRIQVLVTDFANQMFVVLGQVNQPGRYAFPRGVPPRMDLEDAIGTGGGFHPAGPGIPHPGEARHKGLQGGRPANDDALRRAAFHCPAWGCDYRHGASFLRLTRRGVFRCMQSAPARCEAFLERETRR